MKEEIVAQLIKKGNILLNKPFKPLEFTKVAKIDIILNDLDNYPHHFVLACVMDRQIKAEKAWSIPYKISHKIGSYDFLEILKLSQSDIHKLFVENNFHRFNEIMALCFYRAIQKIHTDYDDNASLIWKGNLSSATIVKRFLQFYGVGIKIATMATNILAREFKLPLKDKIYIDISPDVQVKRVFKRLGFISKEASNEELIYCARELNPEYPGIFDLSTWEIGRYWCRPHNPDCTKCYLNNFCPKKDIN